MCKGSHPKWSIYRFQTCKFSQCSCFRQWGFERPDTDSLPDPLLNCSSCETQTRHAYSRLVISRNYQNIDFGAELHWRMPKEK